MDDTNHIHYACEGLVVTGQDRIRTTLGAAEATVATAAVAAVGGGNATLDTVFRLHSRALSTKKIYLDFKGHTTTGTNWNAAYTAGKPIVTPAFDVDGAPGTFGSDEINRIQLIWKRVSEDFAPFDVDVTTEEPAVDSLRRVGSNDLAFGIRVCIGGSSTDWLGSSAGGVAFVGSFRWDSDTPCFVFPAQLSSGNEKYTAESVSHEVGHTLGLTHDGKTGGAGYYQGHNNWAPIMGSSYYANVTQWSKGEYTLASNTQDDLAVMQNNGITLIPDDHGNTILTATALTGTNPTVTGLISTSTDVDVFKFATGAGTVTFTASSSAPATNLDIQLAIYDGSGTLVTFANPTGLASTVTATLASGTYYVSVDGVGLGNGSTGYTDYGSLGNYTLTGTLVATTNQAPVVAIASSNRTGEGPLNVSFSSNGTFDRDGSITRLDWDFGDNTAHSSEASPQHTYTKVGSYTASLVAFDNSGFSASKTLTITVLAEQTKMYVAAITMTTTGNVTTATVKVLDAKGAVVPGAVVRGTWSGAFTGSQAAYTNAASQAVFTTAATTATGTLTFTVTSIAMTGGSYAATMNVITTASVATL